MQDRQGWEEGRPGATRRPLGDGFVNDLDLLSVQICQTYHILRFYAVYGMAIIPQ